jgi:hypothetical protein
VFTGDEIGGLHAVPAGQYLLERAVRRSWGPISIGEALHLSLCGNRSQGIEPAGIGQTTGALAFMIDTVWTLDYDPTRVFTGLAGCIRCRRPTVQHGVMQGARDL